MTSSKEIYYSTQSAVSIVTDRYGDVAPTHGCRSGAAPSADVFYDVSCFFPVHVSLLNNRACRNALGDICGFVRSRRVTGEALRKMPIRQRRVAI